MEFGISSRVLDRTLEKLRVLRSSEIRIIDQRSKPDLNRIDGGNGFV
ncbi:2350_t:CDS:2, partial [Gigaspora rosea]